MRTPLPSSEHLLLTAQLTHFMEDYARCLDQDDLERWPEFFADDARYKITTFDNIRAGYPFGMMYADSAAMLRDRVKALRNANIYEEQRYRHILGLPFITRAAVHTVSAQTSFMSLRIMRDGQTMLFATGQYQDSIAIHGDRFQFEERIVVCDSSQIDTLLALPL